MEKLIIDTRQKKNKHLLKHEFFQSIKELEVFEHSLLVGDYMLVGTPLSIDTKQNISELNKNIKGKDHLRFRNECIKAKEAGIKLVVLVESDEVSSLEELKSWREPSREYCKRGGSPRAELMARKSKKPLAKGVPRRIYGSTLAKACQTMTDKYGVEFYFCPPELSGEWIIDALLTTPPNPSMTYEYITARTVKTEDDDD